MEILERLGVAHEVRRAAPPLPLVRDAAPRSRRRGHGCVRAPLGTRGGSAGSHPPRSAGAGA